MKNKIVHFFEHLFGLNSGETVTWWDIDALMSGFQCYDCGKISGEQMIGVYMYSDDNVPEFKWLITR